MPDGDDLVEALLEGLPDVCDVGAVDLCELVQASNPPLDDLCNRHCLVDRTPHGLQDDL